MIVLDIETSGDLFPEKNGIWQVAALDTDNIDNVFFEEARLDEVEKVSMVVTGKSEEYMRDPDKQSQKEMLERFFHWAQSVKVKNLVCYSSPFDYNYLWARAHKYGIEFGVPKLTVELFTVALTKLHELDEEIPVEDGRVRIYFKNIIEMCGLEDHRLKLKDGKIAEEGTPHNALEDAKLTAECYSRLVYGKKLLPDYKGYEIPEVLKNDA